jgi:hypothetical protein
MRMSVGGVEGMRAGRAHEVWLWLWLGIIAALDEDHPKLQTASASACLRPIYCVLHCR